MPMPMDKRTYELAREKRRALERQSRQCPVYKAVQKSLKINDYLDLKHAIGSLIIDLRYMPEAAATVEILEAFYELDQQ